VGTNWKSLTLEAIAIVVSILLAFAIEAWWSERQERQFEQETLKSLLSEFQGHKRQLVVMKELHLKVLRSVVSLISASGRGSFESEAFGVDEALYWATVPATTDLGSGVRDSLISSGQIEVISNKQLRYRLAEWESVLDELKDDEQHGVILVLETMDPYLTRHGVPLSFSEALSARTTTEPIPTTVRQLVTDAAATKRLLSDPEFRSILELRYKRLAHTDMEIDRVIAETDTIVALLDEV